VQQPLTSGPKGWTAGQVLCWFGLWLHAPVSIGEGEVLGGGESRWMPNHLVGRPRGYVGQPSLGELPT
jgi:hypothetical protein